MFPTSFEWTDPIFCITLTETKKKKQKSKTKQNKKPKNNKKEKSNIEKNGKKLYVRRKQIVPPLPLPPVPPRRKSLMNKSPPTDVLMELTSNSEGVNHEAIAREMIRDICQFCKNTANEIIEN